jgi:hypothetical protein
MRRVAWGSALNRDKWTDREDYLTRTIDRAIELCAPPKLKAASDAQRAYADKIRAEKLEGASPETAAILVVNAGPAASAKFWIDNAGKSLDELRAMVTPMAAPSTDVGAAVPVLVEGLQYMPAAMQLEHFRGCVYVQDTHRILTPTGDRLRPDQFNATKGGYIFQIDDAGTKDTRKAFDAFTESQVVRFPKAHGTIFDPLMPPGAIVEREGRLLVNSYVPIATPSTPGDAGPFLGLLEKVLPVKGDRDILLAYMAACVQHKGVKFQWAPLLQGTEGNGKTAFSRCVMKAIGGRYSHCPKAMDLDNKFNGWLVDKLFIAVEDIYVPENRRELLETLKPMITGGDGIEIQLKGVDQVTVDICANFILNSNHKDALKKTENDRRFAVFYTAQQTAADLARDGMGGDYFPKLYDWLKSGGYAIVTHLLETHAIPEELNPAGACHRAPRTSSTAEAVGTSRGGIEQEIQEAIDSGRVGFAGGWVSGSHLDKLLCELRANRTILHNKRAEMMRELGYIPHPALCDGRVNRPIPIDGGKKSRLYVREGHLAENVSSAAEATRMYESAQTGAGAGAVFSLAK